MDTSKIIKGVVSNGRYTVTAPIIKENYGIYLQIEGAELPETYQVDFSNEEHHGTSVTMIGNADGVRIPRQFIDTGKDIFAFLYWVGEDYGKTVYKFRIPNKLRPDRTDEQPTPEEQSVIDQAINALNSAVEQTAQDKADADASAQASAESAQASGESALSASNSALSSGEYASNALGYAESASASATASANSASASAQSAQSAEQSAQTASAKADAITGLTATATTLPSGSSASASYDAQTGVMSFGIPKGKDGTDGTDGISPSVSVTDITGGHRVVITDKDGAKSFDVEDGATGATPNLTIGTVETLESTESATANITGTPENPVLNLGIPQGEQGEVTLEDYYKAFPTDTASGAVASFTDGADGLPLKSLVVNIEPKQEGAGDPSPDNVRPISGWTGMQVQHDGANIWDEEWEVGAYNASDGTPITGSGQIRSKNAIPVSGMSSIYIYNGEPLNIRPLFYTKDDIFISAPTAVRNSVVSIPSNAKLMRFYTGSGYGTAYKNSISINYPSTDHDYHPYVGQTIPISWQTEAGTIYGGKLDVLSGELVIDRAMVDLGTLDWIMPNDNRFYTTSLLSVIKKGTDGALWIQSSMFRVTSSLSEVYDSLDAMWLSTRGNISVSKIADTAEALKTAVTGQQLVYELATPLTVQLTPNQVNSLLGVNNIFADTGDTEVEYRANTKLYIERLTAPDSADMIADANITSGQYFMVGNSLYKATANIANGGQIIVGTNCTRVSLAQALNEINA